MVVLSLVNGVSLENGTVEGGYHTSGLPNFDSTREHDHAIVVHGASHVRLSGLTVRDVAGDCVDVDRQKRTDTSRVTIVGTQGAPFTCTGTGRQGISANSVTGLRIEGVTFDRIAASGVDLEPRRHGFLKDVMVIGNRFGWIGNYAIAGIGSSPTWQDVTVADNAQTDPAHPGLGFLRAGNSFDRGPLTMTGNRMVNIVQINHTSGRATGNTLVGRPGFDCWFELFNHPPFQVQGNSHPQRVSETCSKLGKIAGSVRPIVRKLKLIAIFIGIAVLVLGVVVGLLVRRRQRRNPDRYVD